MEISLVNSIPKEASIVYPATKDQAVSLLRHHFNIEQVSFIEARNVAGYLKARLDMIAGFAGIVPLVGLIVTDGTVEDEDGLVNAIATARMTRTKVVFIGQVTGQRLIANLFTLNRNY